MLIGACDPIRRGVTHSTHSRLQDWFDFAGAPPGSATAVSLAPLFPDSHTKPLPHAFDWAVWNRSRSAAGDVNPPPPPSATLADRVNWLIGGTAAGSTAGLIGGTAYCESGAIGSEWDYKAALMMHDSFPKCEGEGCASNVTRISLSFGGYITVQMASTEAFGPLPTRFSAQYHPEHAV